MLKNSPTSQKYAKYLQTILTERSPSSQVKIITFPTYNNRAKKPLVCLFSYLDRNYIYDEIYYKKIDPFSKKSNMVEDQIV